MADEDGSARALVQALYAAARLGAMWGFESRLTAEAIDHLAAAVRSAAASRGDLVLRFADGLVHLNDQRVRTDSSGYTAFRHLQERTTRRGIGEISISAGAGRRDLVELLRLLESRPDDAAGDSFDGTRAELSRAAAHGVGVAPPAEESTGGRRGAWSPADVGEAAKHAWLGLAFESMRVRAAVQAGERWSARRVRRAVHDAIDVLERGDTHMLAVAQMRNHRGFGPTHCANTSVLACALALGAGFSKLAAADVGVAAALHEIHPHDAGRVDEAALRSRDRRTARELLPVLGFTDGALRAVLAIRDLHGPADPSAPLVQRILRVACFYDTVTTPAGPLHPGHAPREAFAVMTRDPSRFDPAVVRMLRGLLGVHPFGSVVRLDTGERAIVHGRNPHFDQPTRPIVRVTQRADGSAVADGELVDLSRFDRERGEFLRNIADVRAPWQAFRIPADYLGAL